MARLDVTQAALCSDFATLKPADESLASTPKQQRPRQSMQRSETAERGMPELQSSSAAYTDTSHKEPMSDR